MSTALRFARTALLLLFGLLAVALIAVKLIYGGGRPYPDVSTAPERQDLEVAIETDFPPGMVAVGGDGRVYFTLHPFHAPERFTDALLFEWHAGEARPIGVGLGPRLHGIFGITVDAQGWIWAVRPGALAGRPTEVLAIDPDSGEIRFEHAFPDGVGGFAQDLRVSADGRFVYLADTGLLRFTPAALLVLDTETRALRTVLEGHGTTAPQNWVMRRTDGRPYRLGFGLVSFQVGVDGLELTADGAWLVYAAMTHDGVYRVPTALLTDPESTQAAIDAALERLGPGPMSDGIALDADGAVILTDVENGGLMRLADGQLTTLTRSADVDWADSVSIGPDGAVWFTDSALTLLLDPLGNPPSLAEIEAQRPFRTYRLPPP